MKHTSQRIALAVVLTSIAGISAFGQSVQPMAVTAESATRNAGIGLRNKRYCEVLPVVIKQGQLAASVYNTLGQNDCLPDAWKAMDVNAIKKQFNAFEVVLNGPRYWLMDQIIAKGETQAGETVIIGGLGFAKRAEVVLPLNEMKSMLNKVRNIERETQYVYEAGKPVYGLLSADGSTYVMQTYSEQIDTTLTINRLTTLGDRLKLPKGWKYQVVTLDKDLVLSAKGVAHLIQDDFDNSYQRIEPTDLATPEISS